MISMLDSNAWKILPSAQGPRWATAADRDGGPEGASELPSRLERRRARTIQLSLGGTANLAVLGGNLPPSFATEILEPNGAGWPPAARWAGSPPQLASGPFHQSFN